MPPVDTADFAGAFWVMGAASIIGPFAIILLCLSAARLIRLLREVLK